MSRKKIRFGVWTNGEGSWVAPSLPQDASWERVKKQVLLAERVGYESTLIANFLINPRGGEAEYFETWSGAAALAAITNRIEIVAAIKPRLIHPAVFAKIALGIEDISEGRFAINFVNAHFVEELEDSGIGYPPHDERYEYGTEWIRVWKRLVSGERVTHQGKHFRLEDYEIRPTSRQRRRPYIYSGGESEAGRILAAGESDGWFLHAGPVEEIGSIIEEVARRPRIGESLEFCLSAHPVARETEAEAEEVADEYRRLAEKYPRRPRKKIDPEIAMRKRQASYSSKVAPFAGAAAGLIGSYDQVAEKIIQFHEVGVRLFMLRFEELGDEQERFAEEVIPRVHALAAKRSAPVFA